MEVASIHWCHASWWSSELIPLVRMGVVVVPFSSDPDLVVSSLTSFRVSSLVSILVVLDCVCLEVLLSRSGLLVFARASSGISVAVSLAAISFLLLVLAISVFLAILFVLFVLVGFLVVPTLFVLFLFPILVLLLALLGWKVVVSLLPMGFSISVAAL